MAKVKETVEIKAPPEAVFDLICRIEEFPKYTNHIKEVKDIGEGNSRWVAKIGGINIKWDSTITKLIKGKRIAWTSTRGIKNSGSFDLEPTEKGTRVTFRIEYHLPISLLEDVASFMMSNWLKKVSSDILKRVKEILEG